MQTSFKYKPNKIKYLNNVNTLDNTHRKMLGEFEKARFDCPLKQKRLDKLNLQLADIDNRDKGMFTTSDIQKKSRLKSEIKKLRHEIDSMEIKEMEYYSKVDSVIFDYYDIVERTSGNLINPVEEYADATEMTEDYIATDIPEMTDLITDSPPENDELDKLNKLSQQKRKEKKPT